MAINKPTSSGAPTALPTPQTPATIQPTNAVQPMASGTGKPSNAGFHPSVISALQQYHPQLYGAINGHMNAKPSAPTAPANPSTAQVPNALPVMRQSLGANASPNMNVGVGNAPMIRKGMY